MLNGEIVSVRRNVREYGESYFSGDIVTLPANWNNHTESDRTGHTMKNATDQANTPEPPKPVDMLCITFTRPNLHNVFVYYGNRTYLGVLDKKTRTVYFRTEEDTWLGTVKSGYAHTVGHNSTIPIDTTVSHRDLTIRTIEELLDEALATSQTGSNASKLGRRGLMWNKADENATLDILAIAEYFGNNPVIR